MRTTARVTIAVLFILAFVAVLHGQTPTWPRNDAKYLIDIQKTAGQEITDLYWAHLMSPGQTVSLGVHIDEATAGNAIDLSTVTVQMRYMVHGLPVSPWLSQPFAFTLSTDDVALNPLDDGVHDISVQVQGTGMELYRPRPIFLHLYRGAPHTLSPLVPIMSRDNAVYQRNGYDYGGNVVYVKYADAHFQGYPIDPYVVPWTDSPLTANLYQEEMSPHVDLFMLTQMWWEQAAPPNQGEKFVRGLESKTSEEVSVLWQEGLEVRRPILDGPRGLGWIGSYIAGQVDSAGGLAFVEFGGTVRYLAPDGNVTTVAGYRVKPNRYPIWWLKPLDVVRQNMELRGTWSTQYPFPDPPMKGPLDLAIDPKNERVWYVPGYFDNCIWKVDASTGLDSAAVSVFAGDPAHSDGLVDGTGTAARFDEPASIVFDPVCDCLYVADQGNDAIRKITRAAMVTTPYSHPGMQAYLQAKGLTLSTDVQYTYQDAARGLSHYAVTAAQAASGIKPDIFVPQTVRVDSAGKLLVNDVGFGGVRKIDPATGTAVHIANLHQRFIPNSIGWAWFDVDRWGHAGPKDGVYTCVFQGSQPDGETVPHTNEFYAWVPADGSAPSHFIFNDFEPNPDGLGPRAQTDPPHYCWMVAVDPRGALLMAGGGEHGITRLSGRKATGQPDVPPQPGYGNAENLWNGKVFLGGTLQYGPPPALKFGMLGHNYLGFANSWGMANATDAQWTSAFELPAEITSDATKYASVLNYLKFAAGVGASTTPPVPPDPTPIPPTPPSGTAIWSRQGSDAGMTKYSASDLPASAPTLAYRKNFLSFWDAIHGDFFYANNVVVQSGTAVIFGNEVYDSTLQATVFDWQTGATLRKSQQPYLNTEDPWEIDTHYYTNPLIWPSGRTVYNRRGGDNRTHYFFDPSAMTWTQLQLFQPPDNPAWSGDATAIAQIAGTNLFYRWGDPRTTGPYSANDLTSTPTGTYKFSVGPNNSVSGDRYRYGDVPKISGNVSVIAARVPSYSVVLEAHDLTNGAQLWQRVFPSDVGGGGTGDFGNPSVPDYWRFIATDEGQYVFFNRPSGSCIVHAVDLQTGADLWQRTMDPNDRPILASHGGYVYIIGRAQQLKVNATTGAVAWQTSGSFTHDAGYSRMNYASDQSQATPTYQYRAAILTDSTLWFVNGQTRDDGTLVGLSTTSGQVIASVDLAAAVRTGTQRLEQVQDVMEADGKLGVLLSVYDSADTHVPQQTPSQALLVYDFGSGPPPGDTTPPTISINAPATGVVGTPFTVSATASDNVGVTGGTVTLPGGSATTITYPYSTSFTPTTAGPNVFAFTAQDAAGNSAPASATVNVSGSIPPPTNPLTVSEVVTSCRFTLTDIPPDTTGGWRLQFYRGSTKVGNSMTSGWTANTTLGPGTYSFTGVWTKSGVPNVTHGPTSGTCPGQ